MKNTICFLEGLSMKKIILITFASFLSLQSVFAQKPCESDGSHQFDFWLGEWELTWPGGQQGIPEGEIGYATNHIQKILGDCAIFENFSFESGNFYGQSYSVYNHQMNTWKQTWIDNNGSYLLFEGMFNNNMELRTQPFKRGEKEFISRMVFTNILSNSFDWNWQRSEDGGQTWQDLWNIHYVRKNSMDKK